MKTNIFNTLISILSLTTILSQIESKKLKLVFVVHRHGDRTPVFSYPTNPYNDENKYFPDGIGMLTSKGKQRMYSVGKYIRKRYNNFLTDNPREVYVRSSEKERCLETVSLILAGLYPPTGRWQWDNNIGKVWQPFPIHTMNISHDGLLCPEAICPLAERESKRVFRSKEVQDFLKKYEKTIKLIEEKTELKFKHYWVGRDLFSTTEIQLLNGLKPPDWITQSVYQNLKHISDMAFVFDSSTELLQRMRAGRLLKEIVHNIKESERNPKFGYKIFFYSTHDTYLSIFLRSLKAFNFIGPPFGATIFLELYELSKSGHILELHYLNETQTEKPYKLSLNCPSDHSSDVLCDNCVAVCRLENFLDSIKRLIPNNWEKECNQESTSNFKVSLKIDL